MKPMVISTHEWVYPDVFEYASAREDICLHAPRGGYAAVQILIPGTKAGQKIEVSTCIMPEKLEKFKMIDVRVQYNTGMTLTEYILQKRLIKVAELVRNGAGIERAAGDAGFHNYSHFYKEFVKHKGTSPRKYFKK